MAGDPPPFPGFERLSSERVYASRWCSLRRDQVRLPGGRQQDYHVFEVEDAVVVVPVLRDGRIALLWQYRYPHGRTHWEVPAGRVQHGEAPLEAARRELLEEAGLTSTRLLPLPGFFPINGISDHYAHAFAALDCELAESGTQHEDSEQIAVRLFARQEVEALLHSGRLADGFSALALFYAFALARPD